MANKKTRVRVRRALILLVLLAGIVCAMKGPELLLHSVFHDGGYLPQALVMLALAPVLALLSDWLLSVDKGEAGA